MYVMGDPDRRPVRISYHPQAYLHAGADAAAGALMALYHRGVMGEGQWVNVSIQEAVIHANGGVFGLWNFEKEIQKRGSSTSWKVRVRLSWPCKDGYILWRYRTGVGGNHMNAPFLKWMDDEGMSNDFLKSVDWDTLDLNKEPQELVDRLEEPMGKFFMAHTKAEIYEESLKRDALVYPVTAINDISKDVQLAAREYWVEVEHPELGTTITYPGPFAKTAELPPRISRRAPLIGEHNQEIYEKELGISREELVVLKEAQVI